MRLALIGVGQAGGKVVDELIRYQDRTRRQFIASATAINTAQADLSGLELIPRTQRTLIGAARVKGHGVGADNELGADIAQQSREQILAALDGVPLGEIDAFLVVAALGGGTGSGAGPVVARLLNEVYSEPVYGLGILPASTEGGIYTLNAARSLKTFVQQTDNLLVFDNEAWRKSGETLTDGYDAINVEIAERFGTLFSAGEVRHDRAVAESVVDASEIINTLDDGAISTVGYASDPLPDHGGLLARFSANGHNEVNDTARIAGLVRQAARGRLTLPCDIASAKRALLIVAGPQSYLSREGIDAARQWLEEETRTMEVRAGDFPTTGSSVDTVVVLSGVTKVPRIKRLQALALETRDSSAENVARQDTELDDLLTDERDELDSLF